MPTAGRRSAIWAAATAPSSTIEKITGEHELRTGDKIKIGPLEFEVHLSTSVSGKKKPKVHNVQEAAARTVEAAKPRDNEPDISDWLNEEEDDGDTKNNKLTTTTFVPPTTQKPAEAAPAASGQHQRIDPLADPGQAEEAGGREQPQPPRPTCSSSSSNPAVSDHCRSQVIADGNPRIACLHF